MTNPDQYDINLATHVQQLLFPKSSPVCNWCCIGYKNRMAKGLGGDFFDFITMPDDCQALFVGDVTGHGLHASIVMSLLYGFIHRATASGCAPLATVREVNSFLQSFAVRSKEFDHYFSATLFFGIINPETLEMAYVNAGHPGPMVRRGDTILTLPPTAQPVGFFDNPTVGMQSFQFAKMDRLLLFTDGITEATNPRGELFGLERLKQVLQQNHNDDHIAFLDRLFETIRTFGADESPADDLTAIIVDFHGF